MLVPFKQKCALEQNFRSFPKIAWESKPKAGDHHGGSGFFHSWDEADQWLPLRQWFEELSRACSSVRKHLYCFDKIGVGKQLELKQVELKHFKLIINPEILLSYFHPHVFKNVQDFIIYRPIMWTLLFSISVWWPLLSMFCLAVYFHWREKSSLDI